MPAHFSRVLLAAIFLLAGMSAARADEPAALDWHVGPAAVSAECDAQITLFEQRTSAIAKAPPTFAAAVLALENAAADANDALASDAVLAAAAPDGALREAAAACAGHFEKSKSALERDPAIYLAVARAVHRSRLHNIYDAKLGALWLSAFERHGAGLSPARHAEYLERAAELDDVQARLARSLAGDEPSIELGRRDAAGIPGEVLAGYERLRNGSYRVPVAERTLSFLAYAQSEDARRRYWLAYGSRAAADAPLVQRAIALRDRIAHLLGYESWADYRLANDVPQSLTNAEAFLREANATLQPAAAAELAGIRDALAPELHDSGPALQPWDAARGEYLLRKAHAADEDGIREYFPAQHTLDAALDTAGDFLGVAFERIEPAAAWAPAVEEYRVRDAAGGTVLGYVYFDLFARDGKRTEPGTMLLLPARLTAGVRRPAAAAVFEDWPAPANDAPALLSHGDVAALFGALGRAVAPLLAETPYEMLSNAGSVDAGSAAAQAFEEFAWQPSVLKRIASHWRSGEALPDERIAALVASRRLTQAYDMTRRIARASFELETASSGPHIATATLQQADPGFWPDAAAGADLYAALWNGVIADELVRAFVSGSPFDRRTGARFREQMLAPARTYDAGAEAGRFLRRPVSDDAFFAQLGVTRAENHE